MPLTRRDALSAAATAATAALFLPDALPAAAMAQTSPPDRERIGGFRLGCQAYSFNRFSAWEAIEKTAQAGGTVIEFYPGQRLRPDSPETRLDVGLTDDLIAQVKDKLQQSGVRAAAFGVVGLGRNEARNRQVFEFARKMGIGTLTSEPDAAGMDNIEKLVKEYDIRVAIHNHPRQRNNPNYRFWDPAYVMSLVKDRDKRIGSCADTGHWVRSGVKPVDALRTLKGRVLQSHLKDLHEFTPGGHDVPFGTGVSDIPAVLKELRSQKFDGNISIEYEHNWENSLSEIAQCIGFVRGWGTANR
jgi:sugar phosphate isomerase/epimerase